jgi:hypothetical protein
MKLIKEFADAIFLYWIEDVSMKVPNVDILLLEAFKNDINLIKDGSKPITDEP